MPWIDGADSDARAAQLEPKCPGDLELARLRRAVSGSAFIRQMAGIGTNIDD